MTRDDIIRMAQEANYDVLRKGYPPYAWLFSDEALQRFAALVAAAEREACAKVCEDLREFFSGTSLAVDYENHSPSNSLAYTQCAAAIRARGE
jgi:hypothetical protein